MPLRRAKVAMRRTFTAPRAYSTVARVNAALVPVRSIAGAKQRLARCLDRDRREALALAMLEDMLAALDASSRLDRIVVVSSDSGLLEHARRCGAEALEEGPPRGLNAAVATAAVRLEAQGVRRLLTIPGDVPLLAPEDIDAVFETDHERYPVVLAPSASVTGTNGLLTSPPTVIEFCFEGASLDAYRRQCRLKELEMLVLCLESFAIDVDTPADLAALPARPGYRTCALVQEWRGFIDQFLAGEALV